MAYASSPLRNEAEEFIRSEIARLGPDDLDKGAIVRRYVERGGSKTRVHAWIAALVSEAKNPPPDTLEADLAVAEAAIAAAETAAILDALPTPKEVKALAQAAADLPHGSISVLPPPRVDPRVSPPPDSHSGKPAPVPDCDVDFATVSIAPNGSAGVLADLQAALATVKRVMDHSHGADGKVRNARMALASAETLRRCLDTAMKLYETINNVELVERFMAVMLGHVAKLSPGTAAAIVTELRAEQARWAA